MSSSLTFFSLHYNISKKLLATIRNSLYILNSSSNLLKITKEDEKMCIAIPMKIKSIDYPTAIGEIEGVEREINLQFLDENDIKVGDYVMVHVGFAISKVDEEYVKQFVETVQEIERLEEDAYHKW